MKEVNSVSDATNTYGEDIKLTTTDASTLYKTIITELEKGAGEPLYPGDERRIFGEALVPVFVALYNSLNDVGRQTLLRYARGEVLDAIGERQDVKRLEGTPAKTTMRFSVSTPQEKNIIIPKWTKVTPDSENYFATDEIAVLQAGAYSVEVPTSAVSNGTKFNGYAAGTITTLVDLIPYIESVTNLTETAGGDDGEPYTTEGDNRLRERIRLAPAKRSTAGPEQAYIYWVMTADSSIVDAKAVNEKETVSETLTVYDGKAFKGGGTLLTDTLVVKAHGQSTAAVKDTDYTVDYADGLLAITLKGSLAAAESIDIIITRTLEGCVKIVPLLEGGGIPDAAMLAKVLDVVNAKDIRPLTDKVSAVPPEVKTYDIEIVLGDGYLEEGQTPRTLTGVVSPKATVDITKLKINGDGTVAVGGIFTNGDETEGFYYRELGLYAEDPDPEVGEVLYCYGNCGDLAEWIPPSGGATIVEKTIDIVTAIGTATNVTAYIPADAYATKEDYETYKAIALGAQATAEEALALARQAIAIAQAAEASVNDLSNAVGQNTSKIATLWDAVFSEITTNPFQITFADLTGITLTAGIWNSGLQRLEC